MFYCILSGHVLLIFKESTQSYIFTVMIQEKRLALRKHYLSKFTVTSSYAGLLCLCTEIAPNHLTANIERTI